MDLVTGATGYVGGRLVPRLLDAGRRVRVLAPDPARLAGRAWAEDVEVVRGDDARRLFPSILPLCCGEALDRALERLDRGEVETAYFAPRGLAGHLYWYALYPIHAAIFRDLVRRVAERARGLAEPAPAGATP